jgi:predicted nucleotidyltransferase
MGISTSATAQTAIERVRDILARYPDIELGIVFGSHASGEASPASDMDVAVRFTRPLSADDNLALTGDLASATGRAVDLIDLRQAGEPLIGEIIRGGRRVVGSSEAFAGLLSHHLIEEADFLPIRDRILRERRESWIGE